MSQPPFIVYALPRSRAKWLSGFLTYGDWVCGHEELRYLRNLEDLDSWWKQPCVGTVETAAAPFWRLAPSSARVVVVRRPVEEVLESMPRLGQGYNEEGLHKILKALDAKLTQIVARVPGVLEVQFSDLLLEETCKSIFEHCLPYKHDPAWWRALAPLNLQMDMRALNRYASAHRKQLGRVAAQAKAKSLRELEQSRKPSDLEGVTIQEESFRDSYRDGQALFRDHLTQVGESPDAFMHKNIALMEKLDSLGWLQITTARSNGRMFGYLMAVLSPSLESENILSAVHTTFFAEKSFRGLGLRLQRASVEALRQRGVSEVFFRAGIRAESPRLGTLYKRLGAEPFGSLFRLELMEG